MRLPHHEQFHLTYCTNIHPADGWDAVFATLRRYAPPLKARFAPDAPFGLGLRLSARDASELLSGDNLSTFTAFLLDEGLYVALINGFPYGPFHGTPVKASVYAPDWRHDARLQYTRQLIHRVVYENPVEFLSQSPKFRIRPTREREVATAR